MGKATLNKSLNKLFGSLFLVSALVLVGCTGSPRQVYNTTSTNNGGNNGGNGGSNGSSEWDPFNPDGGSGEGTITFYSNGATLIAWGAARCASYGDSLAKWVGGTASIESTDEGRFQWAEKYAKTGPGGQNYNYYYQIARQATDANGAHLALYPSFAVNNSGALSLPQGQEPAPSAAALANNSLPSNQQALYPNYVLVAFCVPSCYRAGQHLYFANDVGRRIKSLKDESWSVPIDVAKHAADQGHGFLAAVSLAPDSVFGALELITNKIHHFTQDIPVPNPKEQRFYFIRTPHGVAQLTGNHGLIMGDGHARTAEDVAKRFFAGKREQLMTAHSHAVPILDVQAYDLPELSYNLTIQGATTELTEHIVPFGEDEVLALDGLGQQMLSNGPDDLNREIDRLGLSDELVGMRP